MVYVISVEKGLVPSRSRGRLLPLAYDYEISPHVPKHP